MGETETVNPIAQGPRDLSQETKESHRADPVWPEFDIAKVFEITMRDVKLRLAALKSYVDDPGRFDAEIQEIDKELELCRLIADLSSSVENWGR